MPYLCSLGEEITHLLLYFQHGLCPRNVGFDTTAQIKQRASTLREYWNSLMVFDGDSVLV